MFFPHSLRPKVQNEFSLSLQIDLGSMKTHFPPKLVFTRFFFFFFPFLQTIATQSGTEKKSTETQ